MIVLFSFLLPIVVVALCYRFWPQIEVVMVKLFGVTFVASVDLVFFFLQAVPLIFKTPPKTMNDLFDFDYIWRHYFYGSVEDCWNNVTMSQPGSTVIVNRSLRKEGCLSRSEADSYSICVNSGSYNYGGFADLGLSFSASKLSGFLPKLGDEDRDFVDVLKTLSYSDRLELHSATEREIANHLGLGSAICIPTGYGCNFSLIPEVVSVIRGAYRPNQPTQKVLILSDEDNHASIVRGLRSAEGCIVGVFKHNDKDDLIDCFERIMYHKNKNIAKEPTLSSKAFDDHQVLRNDVCAVLVVFEGIYSMSGNICDLRGILNACRTLETHYDIPCLTYCDQAHSWGAIGNHGRGVCEHFNVEPRSVDFTMVTLSKFTCVVGGALVMPHGLKDWENRIRNRVETKFNDEFTTIYNPVECSAKTLYVLQKCKEEEKGGVNRWENLRRNTKFVRDTLSKNGFDVLGDYSSPVIPFAIHKHTHLLAFSQKALEQGVALVVVSYPATPILLPRARMCLSAAHSLEQCRKMCDVIVSVAKEIQLISSGMSINQVSKKKPITHIDPFVRTHCRPLPSNVERPTGSFNEDRSGASPYRKITNEQFGLIKNTLQIGVGCAGPRGFFGTNAIHLKLENRIAGYFSAEASAIYPSAMFLYSSVLPSLVPKKSSNRPLVFVHVNSLRQDVKLGLKFMKARVRTFQHATELEEERPDYVICDSSEGDLSRYRWIYDQGDIIGDRKFKPFLRMISFETRTTGTLGGVVVGDDKTIDKQRLQGSGYTFSAALPVFVCQHIQLLITN